MSIAYDYPAIGPLVKGDTWWTARKPDKEPEAAAEAPVGAAPDLFGKGPCMAAVEIVNDALRRIEAGFVKEPETLETLPVPEALKPTEKRASAFLKEMAAIDCDEPSPLRRMMDQRKIEEAAFLEGLTQSVEQTFVYRTSLPPAAWRRLSVE